MRFFFIIFLNFFLLNSLYSKDKNIESVLKIKPPITYHQNQKYDEIFKYNDKKDTKESPYSFGIDVGIDKELMTIDKLKIDIGTKFKGIN